MQRKLKNNPPKPENCAKQSVVWWPGGPSKSLLQGSKRRLANSTTSPLHKNPKNIYKRKIKLLRKPVRN